MRNLDWGRQFRTAHALQGEAESYLKERLTTLERLRMMKAVPNAVPIRACSRPQTLLDQVPSDS